MKLEELQQQKGIIFDLQRYSLQDGPGIRTTVFLKGCPLKCLWCHNPESMDRDREISYQPERCIGCGRCMEACPHHCHSLEAGMHRFDRSECTRCGLCTCECYGKSLECIGSERTAGAVMDEVLKDRLFYENSGGGMTVSGGEPTSQHEFTYALLRLAKDKGLHTCLETNGYAVFEKIKRLAQWVDLFLYDYKETIPELHEKYTGVSNERILSNLRNLDESGSEIILRCPIIPGLNDRPDHFAGIADLANQMHHILEIDIEPYHPLGISKFRRLGKAPLFEAELFVADERVAKWVHDIQTRTTIPVKRL